jgi:hypothetical protein
MCCLCVVFVAALLPQAPSLSQQPPSHQSINCANGPISITDPAHAGLGGPDRIEPISGCARGVDFATHKVVIYAFAGGNWWVQPTADKPLTSINNTTGKWMTTTHLGSAYAALLVKQSFSPPAKTGSLPDVEGDVVAVDIKDGK